LQFTLPWADGCLLQALHGPAVRFLRWFWTAAVGRHRLRPFAHVCDSVRDLDQPPGRRRGRSIQWRFTTQVVHAVAESATGAGFDPPHVPFPVQHRRRPTGRRIHFYSNAFRGAGDISNDRSEVGASARSRVTVVTVQGPSSRGRPPFPPLVPVPEYFPDHIEPTPPEKGHRSIVRLPGHPYLD